MIEGITAAEGRLHRNRQHLLQLGLTDVVMEAARPEPLIPIRSCHRRIAPLGSGSGIQEWRPAGTG